MSHRTRFAWTTGTTLALALAFAAQGEAQRTRSEGPRGGSSHSSSGGGSRTPSAPPPSISRGGSTSHSPAPAPPRSDWSGSDRRGSGAGTYHGGGGRDWGGHWSGRNYYRHYPSWYSYWHWGYMPYWSTFGWYGGWPWYWDPWWSDWRYVSIYGGPYWGNVYSWRAAAWAGRFGRVKTDIDPEEAEVWLNGKYVGTADDFDGYPDYIYFQPGTYRLEFRLAGYAPWSTDLRIRRGETLKLDQNLAKEPGRGRLDSFMPEAKGMPSGRWFGKDGEPVSPTARRARERDRDRDREADRDRERDRDRDRDRDDEEGDDIVVEERRVERRTVDEPADDGEESEVVDEQAPREHERESDRERERREPSADSRTRVRWEITPEDAAVWVDDEYLGTGEELSARTRGTRLSAGKHSVTVVRPGYETRTLEVEAKAGETVDVMVELEK